MTTATTQVLAHATAREALEAALGRALPAAAVFRVRPLLAVPASHHVDGPDGYEAEQLGGAIADAHRGGATSTCHELLAAAVIVRHPHLAGDLALLAQRPDSAVAVAAVWPAGPIG